MRFPAHVVGLWATLNAVLAVVILAYEDALLPLLLHLAGSALVAAFGLAVLVSVQRHGAGPQLRVPYRSVAAAATGVLGVVVALAVVWGWWLLLFAPYPLVVALLTLRSERVPADAGEGPGLAALRTPQPIAVERPPTDREVREDALEIAHARRRARRGEAT